MALIRRGDINRPLTIEELDGNFDYLEELASAGPTGSSVASVTGDFVDNTDPLNPVLDRGYKVYLALLTQTSGNAPTAIVLENNTGITFSYTYSSTGDYLGTLSSPVPDINKVAYFMNNNTQFDHCEVKVYNFTTNQFQIRSLDGSTSFNGLLNKTTFEVRIYN